MPRAKMPDLTKLIEDLKAAYEAARQVIQGRSDGGTCCFDHPIVSLPYSRSKRVNAAIDEAVRAAGFRPAPSWGIDKGRTALQDFPGSGFQGSPRTLAAEKIAEVLRERGWRADVHYAID